MTYVWQGWMCTACGKTWARYSVCLPWWKRLLGCASSRSWPDMQGQWHRVTEGTILRNLCGPITSMDTRPPSDNSGRAGAAA